VIKLLLAGTLTAAIATPATGLGLSAGVANASPFCYQTGPGYEKCIDSPSGDYFHPIYQGPALPPCVLYPNLYSCGAQ
jgi:hypothetical protein